MVWQAAITEDSDLLAYGCERTLFKMDLASASASLVVWSELQYAQDPKSTRVRHLFDGDGVDEWAKWAGGKFAEMCVLAGCDYLPSLKGVGIRSAHTAVRQNESLERARRGNSNDCGG